MEYDGICFCRLNSHISLDDGYLFGQDAQNNNHISGSCAAGRPALSKVAPGPTAGSVSKSVLSPKQHFGGWDLIFFPFS